LKVDFPLMAGGSPISHTKPAARKCTLCRFPALAPRPRCRIQEGGWRVFRGNELFYVTLANRLMVAQIHTQPSFGVDSIKPLFQLDFPNAASSDPMYDVSPDGQHFAVLTADRAKIHIHHLAHKLARGVEEVSLTAGDSHSIGIPGEKKE